MSRPYKIKGAYGNLDRLTHVVLTGVMALSNTAVAWNIPGHMLSAAIAYQVLQQENPQTIEKVKAVLEKHPWYGNQWQARVQEVPVADHGLVLFMQAARWADDIRIQDRAQNRPLWHYINFPFKPEEAPPKHTLGAGVRLCMPLGLTRVYILCVASGMDRVCAVLSQEFPQANTDGAQVHRGGHAQSPRCQ